MNNKAHLRPKDFDSSGDIIPMACKEEKGDLISREALLKAFANSEHIKETTDGLDVMEMLAIKDIIDNAPTVKPCENCDLYFKAMTKEEMRKGGAE